MTARWQRLWAERPEALSLWIVGLVALVATVTSLANGFAYDDIPMVVEHPMVQDLRAPWEYLRESYWGPQRGNSLYRPLTLFAFALERAAGGGDPFSFHVMNVVLYLATCLVVLALCRELLPSGPALLAAALWAVHPVHVEAVGNVVGQSEMLAGLPLLLAVTLYVRDRKAGPLRARTVAGLCALFVLALLSKEHGILLPGLLAVAELGLRRRVFASGPAVDRSLLVAGKAMVAIVVLYFAVRYAVLGTVLGDTPHPALEKLSTVERALVMLGLLPEVARLLVWPASLHADYSPQAVPFLTSPAMGHLPGVLIVVAYLVGLGAAWRKDRSGVALFALLWLPASWLIVSNIVFASGLVIAERTLLLPSLSVTMLAGWAAMRAGPLLGRSTRVIRLALGAGVAGLLVIAAVHSAERQRVWADNATLFATMVVEAPDNFKAQHAVGEMFASVGAWERAEVHMRAADSLFPGYDLIELSLARLMHFDNRCPEAVPRYDAVIRKRAEAELALIGRTACFLEMRQLSAARDEAVQGIARANAPEVFRALLAKAESSLVANDTVDARNRWFRAGKPTSKSDARLRVPVLLLNHAPRESGRKMPEIVPDSVR